jgi:GMP synthase (glutamine-hydrolysing)
MRIRILNGVITQRVVIVQEADAILIIGLKNHGIYDKVWQKGTMITQA